MAPHPLSSLLIVAALLQQGDDPSETAAATPVEAPSRAGLAIDRGDEIGYVIPLAEVLDFAVKADIAILGSTGMGEFQLSAGTEEKPRAGAPSEQQVKKLGWIRGRAMGDYLNYKLDHLIEARLLPDTWPSLIYRDTQTGTENRKRELMYGQRGGVPTVWFRKDHHCRWHKCKDEAHFVEGIWPFTSDRHCEKCKRAEHRIWRKPVTGEVPAHAVDMLSAIHLARSMVMGGQEEISFALLDKANWWDMTFVRGEEKRIEVPAGSFDCLAIKLIPVPPEGEEEESQKFEGLFGMQGTLSVWLDHATGVPVKIEGLVPAGPWMVDVALELSEYEGTPESFGPVE